MDKTNLVIAFLGAAVLAGLFIQYGPAGTPGPAGSEHFMQKEVGAPVGGSGIGPYDGVNMSGGISGWASTEPHGAAPVGGSPLPSQAQDGKLMFLVGNKVDPSCCPAAFNTDTGCVCLTEDNKDFMASRAGNRVPN
jgi:hypothetical protein